MVSVQMLKTNETIKSMNNRKFDICYIWILSHNADIYIYITISVSNMSVNNHSIQLHPLVM